MPSSEAEQAPAVPARSSRRVPHELWIALVTAVSTLAAAIIGAVVAVDAGSVEVRVVGDGPDSAELQSAVDRLEAENAELRSANDDLRSLVDAEGPASTAPGDATVRRATDEPISLAGSVCIDLDSLPADAPNWDVDDEGDVCVDYLDRFIGTDLTVLDEEPSRADCAAQTYLVDDVGAVASVVGRYVCAWTDAGRPARIEIVDAEPSESTTLAITVWEERR